MQNHVWRPLIIVILVVLAVFAVRPAVVPKDFGVWERGYMYGWHRKSNEAEWKEVSVKYRTAAYCKECHTKQYAEIVRSPHGSINCENCHGPARGHPDDPPTLTIDRSRELCIRCHYLLLYPSSRRGGMKGINPAEHNPEAECVMCHYPHDPRMKGVSR